MNYFLIVIGIKNFQNLGMLVFHSMTVDNLNVVFGGLCLLVMLARCSPACLITSLWSTLKLCCASDKGN